VIKQTHIVHTSCRWSYPCNSKDRHWLRHDRFLHFDMVDCGIFEGL